MNTTAKHITCLLLFASLPVFAEDVSGAWKVDGSIAGNTVNPTCTLKQVENKISGTCAIDANHVVQTEGTIDAKKVTWKYDQEYEGTVYTLTYSGTLDSSASMKGTVSADPSDTVGDFTAKKQ